MRCRLTSRLVFTFSLATVGMSGLFGCSGAPVVQEPRFKPAIIGARKPDKVEVQKSKHKVRYTYEFAVKRLTAVSDVKTESAGEPTIKSAEWLDNEQLLSRAIEVQNMLILFWIARPKWQPELYGKHS